MNFAILAPWDARLAIGIVTVEYENGTLATRERARLTVLLAGCLIPSISIGLQWEPLGKR